jgi:aminoglycoside phosphotransferase (APT) family kinase protein
MDADLREQCALLDALRQHTSIPVPHIRWFEPDASVLGAPFCVMVRAPGRVPTDRPSYNLPGTWTHDLSIAERRTLWHNAMRTFCGIHNDPGRHEAEAVLRHRLEGRTGLGEQLDHWRAYTRWGGCDTREMGVLHRWLEANVPTTVTTSLSWGDARIENMIFDDLTYSAVLDWEMANLGGPLLDLAWWLLLDRFSTDVNATSRLEGFGDRAETLDVWEELTGIPTEGLLWYEVFAAYRFAAILKRMMGLYASFGVKSFDRGDTRVDARVISMAGVMIAKTGSPPATAR